MLYIDYEDYEGMDIGCEQKALCFHPELVVAGCVSIGWGPGGGGQALPGDRQAAQTQVHEGFHLNK